MANDGITSTIEGAVTRVGSYGFCLEGREGWLSLSKFADPRPALPEEGDYVTVGLDKSGYVRSIMSDPEHSHPQHAAAKPAQQPAPRTETPESAPADRETRITRLACLKAAVDFLDDAPDATHETVLTLAEQFEAWVNR